MARRAETRSCCVRCLCVCKVLLNAGGYFLVYAQSKCKGSRQAMKGWGKEKRKEDGDTRREEIQWCRCRWEKKAEGSQQFGGV